VPDGQTAPADGPVVAGVDGSATSIDAALLAAEEATRRGVRLIVVHAWWELADWDTATLPLDADVIATFEREHREVLDGCVPPIRTRYPGLVIEPRLVHAPRTEALLAAAEGASALVVGKHSRAVARELLLGSLSRNILLDVWTPTIVAGLPAGEEHRTTTEPAARFAAV
jgi:nucleotide-binding universal stress UspA family protein